MSSVGGSDDGKTAIEAAANPNAKQLDRIARAYHDLSHRSHKFRTRLIEDFQLADSLADTGVTHAPIFGSRDITDNALRPRILAEAPNQLIKFQIFRRSNAIFFADQNVLDIDRRLTRTKNQSALPFGAWARWVQQHNRFQAFMLFLIIANSAFVAVEVGNRIANRCHDFLELEDTERDYYQLFRFINIFDLTSILIFLIELGLQWIDDFENYWRDGWKVFDFIIIILSTVPRFISLADGSSVSQLTNIANELRVLRILRTLKLVIRFGSLKIIVLTIMAAFKSIAFILLLMSLVAYIFAVFAVTLFDAYNKSTLPTLVYSHKWTTVGESLQTLFQILTIDHWRAILDDLRQVVNPVIASIYVIVWIWLGSFIFRNVFVGIMVNNFSKIADEIEEQKKAYLKQRKFEKLRKKLHKELNNQKATGEEMDKEISKAVAAVQEQRVSETNADAIVPPTSDTTTVPVMPELRVDDEALELPDIVRRSQGMLNKYANVPVKITKENVDDVPGSPKTEEGTIATDAPPADAPPARSSSMDELLSKVTQLLCVSHTVSKDWEKTVVETLNALSDRRQETAWPRDTLFRYYQIMEKLQENMKEYEELQHLAVTSLVDLHDD